MAGGEDSGLEAPMLATLLVCIATFTLLFFTLLRHRLKLQSLRDEVDALQDRVEQAG
jgi:hypothetical protein